MKNGMMKSSGDLQSVAEIFSEVRSLTDKSVENLEKTLHNVSLAGANLAEFAYESAQSALKTASDKAMEGYDKAISEVKHASEKLSDTVKKHPIATVAVVGAVGVIIGRYACPKNRR